MSDLTPLNFPFGPLDERTDSKVLPVPRLSSLMNFTRLNDGALQKRFGTRALGTDDWLDDDTIAPIWVASDNTELLAFTDQVGAEANVFSWAPTRAVWKQKAWGSQFSLTERRSVSKDTQLDRWQPSSAYKNGLTLHAWTQDMPGSTANCIHACLVEEATGSTVIAPVQISDGISAGKDARCIALGNNLLVFFMQGSSLMSCTYNTASASQGDFGAITTVATGLSASHPHQYDVCAMADGAHYAIVWVVSGNADYVVKKFTAAHAEVATDTRVVGATCYAVGIDATANWVFVARTSAAPDIGCRKYTTALVSTSFDTETIDDSTTEVGVKETSVAGVAVVHYSHGNNIAKWRQWNDTAFAGSVVSHLNFMFNSRAFLYNSNVYCFAFTFDSTSVQNNLYLVQLTDNQSTLTVQPWAHGRFAVGTGAMLDSTHRNGYSGFAVGHGSGALPSGTFRYDAGVIQSVSGPTDGSDKTTSALLGIDSFKFSALEANRYLDTQTGTHWCFGGGQVYHYDGEAYAELGFSNFPVVTAAQGTNGSMVNGIYQYRVVWEWVDARGIRHQSQPSAAISFELIGVYDEIVLTISGKPFTRKSGNVLAPGKVVAAVYRTAVGGSTFYRVEGGTANKFTDLDPEGGGSTVQYNDVASDAACSLTTREQLYTNGGANPNVQPPASRFLCSWGNRLWGIDDEFPDELWFTHEQQFQQGLAWSYPYKLSIPDGGPCVALAAQDRLLILKRDAIMVLQGDGPSRTNVGSFFPPETICRGIGCVDARSVVTDQDGTVYFQSQRGIEALGRGAVSPVLMSDGIYATLNTYPVVAHAKLFPEQNVVTFLLQNSAGTTSVFADWNFRTQEWLPHTPRNATTTVLVKSMTRWQNTLTFNEAAVVRQRDTGYDDAGTDVFVSALLETGDVRFDMVGRVQIPDVLLLGKFLGNCTVGLYASYDGGTTYTDDNYTWNLTTADYTAGQPVQLLWQPRYSSPAAGFVRYKVTVNVETASVPTLDSGGFVPNGLTLMVRNLGKGPLLGSGARS